MSLNVPSRRLVKSASTLSPSSSAHNTALIAAFRSLYVAPNSRSFHSTPQAQWFWGRKKKDDKGIEAEMMGTKDARKKLMGHLGTKVEGQSIFEDEISKIEPQDPDAAAAAERDVRKVRRPGSMTAPGASLAKDHLARAIDPDPRSRERWERKMIIHQIKNGTNPFSREKREDRIARTERQLRSKSPWFATSTKKLVKLAHQIQGKTVEDAIVQMRYSKKKMAREVKIQLEQARDQAVVERGMGLGGQQEPGSKKPQIKIQTKEGKHLTITDPSKMYVAEAWVNRGPFRNPKLDYRARGKLNFMWRPTTSISVVLKEEKTRIREHEERVAKKLRRKPWVHLPDRPIYGQRQHYSW
ncbi:ribosomal protein L22/L17 [Rhypophila decipiens]|uniref:Ribosomal protein L22/L17 n=1 Tax=Rhypophila decipiens TaxID=261697 RepID=A0AAN7BB69_9PEZI|nr:ribosomal protein L22/L17 [Rhypophila decipiens]